MTRFPLFATGIVFLMATAAASGCSGGASSAADGGPGGGSGADGSTSQLGPDGSAIGTGSEGGTTGAGGEAGAAGPCGGNPVFCDDYTGTAAAGAYTTYHGTWTRAATGYAVTDATDWERARSTLAGAVSSFDVTIEGTTVGDDGLGIVYGGSASADDGYAVLVHPAQFQGIYLKQLVPGQSDVLLATAPLPAGLAGMPLKLRVVRQGTQVTAWLNGTQVLQASDRAPALHGRLGLLLSDTNLTTTDAGAPAGAVFHLLRVDSESDSGSDGGSPEGGTPPGVVNYAVGITPDDGVDQQIAAAANQPGGNFPLTTTYNYHPGSDWAGWASISLSGAAYYSIQISPSPDAVAFDANDIANNHQADFENIAKVVASFGSKIVSANLGWEWNDGGANDRGFDAPGMQATYITFYRNFAKAFQQYAPNVIRAWCMNHVVMHTGGRPEDFYPGDDVVDAIGMEPYQVYAGGSNVSDDTNNDWGWANNFSKGTFKGANHPGVVNGVTIPSGGQKYIVMAEFAPDPASPDTQYVSEVFAWAQGLGGANFAADADRPNRVLVLSYFNVPGFGPNLAVMNGSDAYSMQFASGTKGLTYSDRFPVPRL